MKYLFLLLLFLSFFTIQAQNTSDFISEEKIIEFAQTWSRKNSLKYLEAMKEAQKVFVVGKKVNQTLLKQKFSSHTTRLNAL